MSFQGIGNEAILFHRSSHKGGKLGLVKSLVRSPLQTIPRTSAPALQGLPDRTARRPTPFPSGPLCTRSLLHALCGLSWIALSSGPLHTRRMLRVREAHVRVVRAWAVDESIRSEGDASEGGMSTGSLHTCGRRE